MTEPPRDPDPWPPLVHPTPGPAPAPQYGVGQPPPRRREAPVGLAIASGVVAGGVALLEVATAVASVPAASEFSDEIDAGGSAYNVFTTYDALEILVLPGLVAAYVVSCLWLQFARSNTAVISPGFQHRRGGVWVWLGWWVPIVNLWFPLQVVRDVGEASGRGGAVPGVGLWWAGWLVYLFGNRIGANISTSAESSVVAALPMFETITALGCVVACVMWCRLLHRITQDQAAALS